MLRGNSELKKKVFAGIELTMLFIVTMTSTFGIHPILAQNSMIVNGDFETGSMSGWSRDPYNPGGTVTIQSSIVHNGSYALKIDTLNASYGDFVYQNVSLPHASFEFECWVYRESGKGHRIELVRDWNFSGDAYFVTSVCFRNDTVEFGTWTHSREHWEGLSIPYILSSGTWHHVEVKANATSITQELFIDDGFIAEQISNWTYLPEHIILGDVGFTPCQGLFYYDDVCLTPVAIHAVGGISLPVNKLELLAPYIGLTILLAIAVISVVYVKKRKRNTEINS